jgi:hypothetical protein
MEHTPLAATACDQDRPAEGDVLGRVAVASQGHVPAGEEELEPPAAGLADQGDRLPVAEAAGVVFELTVVPLVPGRIDQPLEDLPDQLLLVLREEVARHLGVGDVPVVAHAGAEQAELRVHVVPPEADLSPLGLGERRVEATGERLGRRHDGFHRSDGGAAQDAGRGGDRGRSQQISS